MNCFAWAFHACHASNDVASSGLQASSPVFEEVEENSPFPGHSFARIKLGGHSCARIKLGGHSSKLRTDNIWFAAEDHRFPAILHCIAHLHLMTDGIVLVFNRFVFV